MDDNPTNCRTACLGRPGRRADRAGDLDRARGRGGLVAVARAACRWPRWAVAFWVLRVVGVRLCAVDAGRADATAHRSHDHDQSIAIFADGSDSMEVVDPPEPTDALRWALAIDGRSATSRSWCAAIDWAWRWAPRCRTASGSRKWSKNIGRRSSLARCVTSIGVGESSERRRTPMRWSPRSTATDEFARRTCGADRDARRRAGRRFARRPFASRRSTSRTRRWARISPCDSSSWWKASTSAQRRTPVFAADLAQQQAGRNRQAASRTSTACRGARRRARRSMRWKVR